MTWLRGAPLWRRHRGPQAAWGRAGLTADANCSERSRLGSGGQRERRDHVVEFIDQCAANPFGQFRQATSQISRPMADLGQKHSRATQIIWCPLSKFA